MGGTAAALALVTLLATAWPSQAAASPRAWPALDAFVSAYVSDDGRVIDRSEDRQVTTSEGQAYALFFALVAGDRPLFARLLRWTHNNLAAGDLGSRLPAWQWGRHDDGRWTVLDANSASDADLWLALTLIEAGERWQERGYRVLGKSLAARILSEEAAELPGLGLSLLPGLTGFALGDGRWRLNPSYLPRWQFQRLAATDPAHRDAWQAMAESAQRTVVGSARNGFAPDWAIYDVASGFQPDTADGDIGSYNAIRSYLWAGLLPASPQREAQLAALHGMAATPLPPRIVALSDGSRRDDGPVGFMAALLPYRRALGQPREADALRERVTAAGWPLTGYYDSVLVLFGLGADDGRYCFDGEGRLRLGAEEGCAVSR